MKQTDPGSDPFRERAPAHISKRMQLLGASCRFESDSRDMLRLVETAYAGVPAHRLAASTPELRIKLMVHSPTARSRGGEPPPLSMLSGHGLLGATTDRSNWVMLSPRTHTALIGVSPRMVRFPYHLRYEYIEFCIFTLAARVQQLVPLHAACVGRDGRGVLLMGSSGAGKSTVALHGLLQGLEFVAEDAVFVTADGLQATGIANYLHVSEDSLKWLSQSRELTAIRRSPTIRRRSGVQKYELDLRRRRYRLAPSPLQIVAVVFLSKESAPDQALLRPLRQKDGLSRLNAHQAYAVSQPRWRTFRRHVAHLDAFELRRGSHPREAVAALQGLLDTPVPAAGRRERSCA